MANLPLAYPDRWSMELDHLHQRYKNIYGPDMGKFLAPLFALAAPHLRTCGGRLMVHVAASRRGSFGHLSESVGDGETTTAVTVIGLPGDVVRGVVERIVTPNGSVFSSTTEVVDCFLLHDLQRVVFDDPREIVLPPSALDVEPVVEAVAVDEMDDAPRAPTPADDTQKEENEEQAVEEVEVAAPAPFSPHWPSAPPSPHAPLPPDNTQQLEERIVALESLLEEEKEETRSLRHRIATLERDEETVELLDDFIWPGHDLNDDDDEEDRNESARSDNFDLYDGGDLDLRDEEKEETSPEGSPRGRKRKASGSDDDASPAKRRRSVSPSPPPSPSPLLLSVRSLRRRLSKMAKLERHGISGCPKREVGAKKAGWWRSMSATLSCRLRLLQHIAHLLLSKMRRKVVAKPGQLTTVEAMVEAAERVADGWEWLMHSADTFSRSARDHAKRRSHPDVDWEGSHAKFKRRAARHLDHANELLSSARLWKV